MADACKKTNFAELPGMDGCASFLLVHSLSNLSATLINSSQYYLQAKCATTAMSPAPHSSNLPGRIVKVKAAVDNDGASLDAGEVLNRGKVFAVH